MLDRDVGGRARHSNRGGAHAVIRISVELEPDVWGRLRCQRKGATIILRHPQGSAIDAEKNVLARGADGARGPIRRTCQGRKTRRGREELRPGYARIRREPEVYTARGHELVLSRTGRADFSGIREARLRREPRTRGVGAVREVRLRGARGGTQRECGRVHAQLGGIDGRCRKRRYVS